MSRISELINGEISPEMVKKTMRYRYVVFAVISLAYFFVFFHRLSTAVMAPDLGADFGIDPIQVGLFGSMYFYSYSISQLASGILADRWGPRKTASVFTLIAGAATLMFALTKSFPVALTARLLVGIGVAFIYIPALRLLADWFKEREYATFVGILIAVGNIGGLAATAPLVLMMTAFGWRNSMVYIAFITILIGLLVYLFIRNKPEDIGGASPGSLDKGTNRLKTAAEPRVKMSVFEVLKHLLRKYNLWVLLLLKFGWVGTLMAIQGLWAGPYLMNVYQLSKQETGNILLFIALGAIIGAPLIGYIADRAIIASKKLLMIGAIGTIITLLPMVFLTADMSLNFIKLLFFSFGVFSYFNIVGWVNIRENIEPSMIGTASGIVNFVGFFGGAIFQQIMGFIIARAPMVNSSLAASGFRSAFLFCLVYLIIALSVFSTQRKAATD